MLISTSEIKINKVIIIR